MNKQNAKTQANSAGVLTSPAVGTGLTIASGVSFLVLCMILPLVGQAAANTPYYAKNKSAFMAICLLSLLLAVLAVVSKLARRKIDGSPLPLLSILLSAACLVLLLAALTDLLSI